MNSRNLLLVAIILIFSKISNANNIAIIDSSILHNYKIQAGSDILTSRCYSVTDQGPRVEQPSDPFVDPHEYFTYKFVSFCPDKTGYDTDINQRSIITRRVRSNGFRYYRHFLDDHMSDVMKIALRNTSAKSVPITTGFAYSKSGEYIQGSHLAVAPTDLGTLYGALDWVLDNRQSYNIRVINVSLGFDKDDDEDEDLGFEMLPRYHSCDQNLPSGAYREVRDKISQLRSAGILVVAPAGNGKNKLGEYTNETMMFPACLSNVIAVFGADYKASPDRIKGHFSAKIASKGFLANYYQTGWKGDEVKGTSYSSAYVAGQISELMRFNPGKSSNQILTDIRSTVSRRDFRFYLPNGIEKWITNLPIINFSAARSRILSDSTYGAWIDMIDSGIDSGQYGWNYGTRQHRNGVQIAVTTSSFSSTSAASALSRQTTDQTISQLTTLEGAVTAATTSTKTYYRFSLQGYDVDTVGELTVYVNNHFYGYIIPTGNNSTGSRQYFYIEASHLNANQPNFIKVVQRNSGETYGITNIQLARQSLSLINTSKTGSRITLSETENPTAYGYNGAGTFYSQLKSKFYYTGKGGLELSLRGYDFDQNNEVSIYVNNQFLTYISATGNNTYGNKIVEIPHDKLLEGQWNNIDFRKAVRTDHKWVVDKLKVSLLQPKSIVPILQLLLLDD